MPCAAELLHCLSTLPDPWPLAKVTINMDSASQWVSKMGRLFFADEYVGHEAGTQSTEQLPQLQTALKAVKDVLPDLETRVIEFLAEWLVALLMPAKHVLESRSPHLAFMLIKDYWFHELYLGLKVAESSNRDKSFTKTIDRQIRCIAPEYNSQGTNQAWNVSYINVFIPAWMVPPVYHSLHREHIRLRLKIREDAFPFREQLQFQAWSEVASRGLLAADFFFWSAPVAFRRVALKTPEWTSRDSNHHWQSVSAGKINAIPTEPSGRLWPSSSYWWMGRLCIPSPQLGPNGRAPITGKRSTPSQSKPNWHRQTRCTGRSRGFYLRRRWKLANLFRSRVLHYIQNNQEQR